MQKSICLVLIAALVGTAYSACADGSWANGVNTVDSTKGQCTPCLPFCVTCTTGASCTKYIDRVKGVDSAGVFTCATAGASINGAIGYNSVATSCEICMDGCLSCAIDYNICTDCKQGWDFDRNGLQCVRATLGLAAVVLALSVLTLIVMVITCICACKL